MTVTYVIATGREGSPVTGFDSMIADLPWWLEGFVAGEAYPAWLLDTTLRSLSVFGAANLGEVLHHAEWWITADPATVEEKGMIHGCPSCRAGTDQALTVLRERPGRPLLVGLLYWAGDDAG